jgi:uncharacterized OsmC-like protein
MPEVKVERVGDGFEAVNGRGARVAVGSSDQDGVFTPVELLLAALGGCELVSVEPLTAKRGHRLVRLGMTVQADKIATSRLGDITVTYDVELPEGDEKAGEVFEAVSHRVSERYCTVGNALKEPMKIEHVLPARD